MLHVSRTFGLTACILAIAALACVVAPAHARASGFERGFTLTGWKSASYLSDQADRKLQRMAGDGSDHVAIFSQWFMQDPSSSHLAPDPDRTPSDASMLHAAAAARATGMEVTFKPQVGIYSGGWIGGAHPADLDAFWADYRAMMLHYADLAEEAGASMLVIGTEMKTLSGDEARWRPLIAELRTHFHGKLSYAANYDEFQSVPFWDALDYIGIDAYFQLADASAPAPGADQLASAWTRRGYIGRIASVAARTGKPVLFTEIGYRGTHATAVQPNIWDAPDVSDPAAQASAYEAFYRAVATQPWMAGVYWWSVDADSWWVQDFSPLAKPAEQVMAGWNAVLGTQPAATTGQAAPAATAPSRPPTAPPAPTAAPTSPAPLPKLVLELSGRRLRGAVMPYRSSCRARVTLQRRGARRHIRAVASIAVDPRGRFSRTLPHGRAHLRAVVRSRCGAASSRWIATR